MFSLTTLLFATSAVGVALPKRQAADSPVFFPLKYEYNGYPKVYTDITFGTPEQPPVPAVVDLGSANFWVYDANASIYYGSNRLGVQGHCRQVPSPAYNLSASSTAADQTYDVRSYSYGGNSKTITSYYAWNETIGFGVDGVSAGAALENLQVAVANMSLVRQQADECTGLEYDSAILGISESTASTDGPSFRQNLLDGGLIGSSTLSMWFDEAPEAVDATFHGVALFGAVPKSKYSGELVKVPKRQPASSIGYYVDKPVWSVTKLDGSSTEPRVLKYYDDTAECLIDSGSGQDYLPIDRDDFLDATGLSLYGAATVAFNGSCEDMPKDAALSLKFAGADDGASVTVDLPLRNYARGNLDTLTNSTVCGLSLRLNEPGGCTLGAPFSSAVFLAVNDEAGEIAIAQGGVSTGSLSGAEGLGEVVYIGKGEGLSKVLG